MKELKARQLEFDDTYEAVKILKNVNIELTEAQLEEIQQGNLTAAINIMKNIVADAGKAKKEINAFLGGLFGISGEEFGHLGFAQSMDCMKQIKNLEGVGDFMSAVGQLMS